MKEVGEKGQRRVRVRVKGHNLFFFVHSYTLLSLFFFLDGRRTEKEDMAGGEKEKRGDRRMTMTTREEAGGKSRSGSGSRRSGIGWEECECSVYV